MHGQWAGKTAYMSLTLIFAKFFFYQYRQGKKKLPLTSFERKVKNRYQIEMYNQEIKINSAKFIFDWTSCTPLLNELLLPDA